MEEETARAVRECTPLLDGIAKERIREEWSKLLLGKTPSGVLNDYPEVVSRILPEIAPVSPEAVASLAASPADLPVRLALLFDRSESAKTALLRLRYDNETQEEVERLVSLKAITIDDSVVNIRRLLRVYPSKTLLRLFSLLESKGDDLHAARINLQTVLSRGDCTSLQALAVDGNDLIALGIPAGKQVGAILETLLTRVIDGDLPNEKAALLEAAKALAKK